MYIILNADGLTVLFNVTYDEHNTKYWFVLN